MIKMRREQCNLVKYSNINTSIDSKFFVTAKQKQLNLQLPKDATLKPNILVQKSSAITF